MLLYFTWNFHAMSSSFSILLMISDVDREENTHTQTRDGVGMMVGKFLSCSKLNQANFHLSFSHIYASTYSQHRDMFQKLNIRFQLHCLLPFYLLTLSLSFFTISGHKQRAFLRFLKLLYISNHLLCCCCWCSFT